MKEAKRSKQQSHKKKFACCKKHIIIKPKNEVIKRKKLKRVKKQLNDKVAIVMTSLSIIIPSCMATLV